MSRRLYEVELYRQLQVLEEQAHSTVLDHALALDYAQFRYL